VLRFLKWQSSRRSNTSVEETGEKGLPSIRRFLNSLKRKSSTQQKTPTDGVKYRYVSVQGETGQVLSGTRKPRKKMFKQPRVRRREREGRERKKKKPPKGLISNLGGAAQAAPSKRGPLAK